MILVSNIYLKSTLCIVLERIGFVAMLARYISLLFLPLGSILFEISQKDL